jgi:hypothetical protein
VKDHERFHVMAEACCLGSLDPADEATFAVHVAGCGPCRRFVDATSGSAAELMRSRPAGGPPPELRRRVLRSAAADRRLSTTPGRHPAPVGPVAAGATVRVAVGVTLGVAVLVSVLAALTLTHLHRPDLAATDPVARVLGEPGSRIVPLPTVPGSRAGPGNSWLVIGGGRLVLVTGGLPPIDDAHRYALWRRFDPLPWMLVGTFGLPGGSAGRPATEVAPDLTLLGAAAPTDSGGSQFAVSLERAGLLPVVPSAPVLVSAG